MCSLENQEIRFRLKRQFFCNLVPFSNSPGIHFLARPIRFEPRRRLTDSPARSCVSFYSPYMLILTGPSSVICGLLERTNCTPIVTPVSHHAKQENPHTPLRDFDSAGTIGGQLRWQFVCTGDTHALNKGPCSDMNCLDLRLIGPPLD